MIVKVLLDMLKDRQFIGRAFCYLIILGVAILVVLPVSLAWCVSVLAEEIKGRKCQHLEGKKS